MPATLGNALKTTSVDAHARPGKSLGDISKQMANPPPPEIAVVSAGHARVLDLEVFLKFEPGGDGGDLVRQAPSIDDPKADKYRPTLRAINSPEQAQKGLPQSCLFDRAIGAGAQP